MDCTTKKELRLLVRQRKKQYSQEELVRLSQPIVERLLAHPRVRAAQVVLAYCSLPDEVYTRQLIDDLFCQGKTVLLPRCLDHFDMELRLYQGPASLEVGAYGIMEPIGPLFTDYQCIEVGIIPGMSFDGQLNRLGRGKGYYDRFLSKVPELYKIGVCFDFQRVDHVPCEATDIKMNEIV